MWSDRLEFYVNGVAKEVVSPDPEMTLLQYLRNEGLTGTKLGCGEGGCGACTVMLSSYDHQTRKVKHRSVNACLTPVCAVDGCHVITIEGLGGMKRGLHQIQKRVAEANGSQCGFCTPGIVMALYALFRNHPNATKEFIEENMDGNLCRCTGYRPILDAAKSLTANVRGCCMGGNGPCPCREGTEEKKNSNAENSNSQHVLQTTLSKVHNEGFSTPYDPAHDESSAALIFPPQLMLRSPLPLKFTGYYHNRELSWFRPLDLPSLLALKHQYRNDAKLVIGNTEIGIETKFKKMYPLVLIAASNIPELQGFEITDSGVFIGPSTTLADIEQYFHKLIEEREPTSTRSLVAINNMLRWFASNQIRNVSAIAGNIVTASPISDMNPMLSACDAILYMRSQERGERTVPISQFFLSYRTVNLQPDEIITRIFIPLNQGSFEFVQPYKQARRREDDISIVCAGIRMNLFPNYENSKWEISEARMAFGGMAPTTVQAKKTQEFLTGKEFSKETMAEAYQILTDELFLPDNVPGGQSVFRRCLPASFLFKFFVTTSIDLKNTIAESKSNLPNPPLIDLEDVSASVSFVTAHKPSTSGEQSFHLSQGGIHKSMPVHEVDTTQKKRSPVGDPVIHKSAYLQVSGEAVYTDDIPVPRNTLYASLVVSQRAHAKIISIDTSDALKVEGVQNIFTYRDVPGENILGPIFFDEAFLPVDEVFFVGQPIAIVVAETLKQAEQAVALVKVDYENLKAIISIQDAIEEKSFHPYDHMIENGDLEKEFKESDVVVEGEFKMGAQEHFYLETHGSVAIPHENDEIEIFAATQNPTETQILCSHFLGVPENKIKCRVKRLGGGFGGKESRSIPFSCYAALAAYHTRKPVKIMIERDLDMASTGQRHAFVGYYKAGATREGKLKALDVKLFSNCGFSFDLSTGVMDRAIFHVDNCYSWPALRVEGKLCKTNQSSHTAFRGFGGPQGMFVCENAMDKLSQTLGIPMHQLQCSNFYQQGERVHFGQALENWYIQRIWSELLDSSNFEQRKNDLAEFNRKNRWRKRGIAITPTKFAINFTASFLNQGGSLVHVYKDGTVLISHGGVEMGQGLHTKVIQIAAHSFGIPESDIFIAETATDKVANTSPSAASASTDLYGMSTLNACEQIKTRLKPLIEKMPDAPFSQIVKQAFFQRINLSAQGFYAVPLSNSSGYDFNMVTTDNSKRGRPFNYVVPGAACSEVEIDCLTGDSRILRTDIVMDLGSSINPTIDIGQIEGAFVQGFGWCTMEEMVWGDKDHKWVREGHVFTKGPGTYKIPSFNDVPVDFRVKLLPNVDNPFAVHSSKAVGEPPFFLAAAAFFAIKEAIRTARMQNGLSSQFDLHSPATSERIRIACGDQFVTNLIQNDQYQPNGSW